MPRVSRQQFVTLLPYVLIAAAGAVVAYWELFSYFAVFDDEGYYLVSIQSFINGGNLYSDVYSQYGPLYYEIFGAIYKFSGLPITNDAARFVVLFIWIGTALTYGLLTELLTKRRSLGILAALAAFSILRFNRIEPMTPVTFLALLTALSLLPVAAGTRVSPKRLAAVLGAAISALALIKINVGALYALAVIAAALMVFVPAPRRKPAFALATALLVLTPIALTWSNNDLDWVRGLVVLEVAAVAAIAITAWPRAIDSEIRLWPWLLTLVKAALVVAIAVCGVIVILGTGPAVLLDGVVLDPSRYPKVILWPATLPAKPLLLGLAAIAGALCASPLRARLGANALLWSRAVVRLLAATGIVIAATQAIDLGPFEAQLGIPLLLAWIAIRAPAEFGEPAQVAFGRLCIVLVAVVLAMSAYPFALSRESAAALPLILVAALIATDGIRLLATVKLPATIDSRVPAIACAVLGLLVGLQLVSSGLVDLGREGRDGYRSGVPVGLPGTDRIRLPRTQAAAFRRLTAAVAGCDPLVMMPEYPSLYLWSGLKPPTGQNTGAWVKLFDADRQQRVVDAIKGKPKLCVIRNEQAVQANYDIARVGSAPDDLPLRRYLLDTPLVEKLKLNTGVQLGDLTLLVRPQAAAKAPPG
jgi:hypothetical protein